MKCMYSARHDTDESGDEASTKKNNNNETWCATRILNLKS